jgi:ribosome production factor 1
VQLFAGNDADEFNAVLKQHIIPKVLITTCRFNSGVFVFCAYYPCFLNFLLHMLPAGSHFVMILKKIVMLHDLTLYFLLAYIQRGPAFIEELMQVIPNSHYVKRGTYELKKVCHLLS